MERYRLPWFNSRQSSAFTIQKLNEKQPSVSDNVRSPLMSL